MHIEPDFPIFRSFSIHLFNYLCSCFVLQIFHCISNKKIFVLFFKLLLISFLNLLKQVKIIVNIFIRHLSEVLFSLEIYSKWRSFLLAFFTDFFPVCNCFFSLTDWSLHKERVILRLIDGVSQ